MNYSDHRNDTDCWYWTDIYCYDSAENCETYKTVSKYVSSKHWLDINGMLDGKFAGGIEGYGTCDIYMDGKLVADDCSDFYSTNGTWPKGTKYEIKDIKPALCKKYDGVYYGTLSGTLNGNTSVSLKFTTAHDYSVKIIETTCTTLGSKTYTCKTCGDTYTEKDTALLPHDYRKETFPATCSHFAGTKYTCRNCGDTYTEYAAADWSDWSETYPEGMDERLIESRTEYSYSEKQTTTSENASLNGWTRTGSEDKYGAWSGWSDWQTDVITTGDSLTKEVETGKVYRYYYFLCPSPSCPDPHQPLSGKCDCGTYTVGGTVKWSTIAYQNSNSTRCTNAGRNYKRWTTSLGDGQKWIFSGSNLNDTAMGTLDDGNGAVVITTGYRFRTRTKTIIYKYEKWSDWSDWSSVEKASSDERKVKTRTVYRYNRTHYGDHSYEEGSISDNTITYKCTDCDKVEKMPVVSLKDEAGILTAELAKTDKITAQGIVYGRERTVTLDTPGRTRIAYSEIDAVNRSYSFNAAELSGYTIRAYAVYMDESGDEKVAYSDAVVG